ncbi:Anion exchange protein [Aphelenchoides besseyi]|nr:Anion exchange protein [Aphelenchoides besseyi]
MDRTDETKKPLMAVSAEDVQEHLNSSMAGRKRSAYGPHVTFDIESPQRVPSYESLSNVSSTTDPIPPTSMQNSNQAQIFVELYDLKLDDATNVSGVWRETARWIKYEEDVEGADLRWGRPHVPLLSFHALNLLPKLISKVVLLDSKASSFVEVCDDIAKGISDQCNVDSQQIKKLLMLNHSHVPNRRISRISTMFFDRSDPTATQKPPERSRSAAPFPQTISAGNTIHQSASTNSHLNTTHNDLNTTRNSLMNTMSRSHDNHSLDPSPSRGPRRNRSISAFVRKRHRRFVSRTRSRGGYVDVESAEMNGCTLNGNSKRHCANGIRPMVNGGDPPGDDPSKRKRRFFNGLVEDVKNRFPHYGSDFRDALNFQCLTSVIFLFLASVAPAITFGGLLGSYTDEKIGTIETLIAQCPVLVFETSLYMTCNSLDLDFMAVRLFAGIWIFIISIVITAVDGSRLLVYVTRFTEDIFATLISFIFIAESFSFINSTFKDNPVENFVYYETAHAKCGENHGFAVPNLTFAPIRNVDPLTHLVNNHSAISGEMVKREAMDNAPLSDALNTAEIYRKLLVIKNNNGTPVALQPVGVGNVPCLLAEPNTALLTAIIMFSTFALAFLLKKTSRILFISLRRALGDFGVLIAVALVALAVQSWIPDPFLARLEMPDELNFTNPTQRAHGLIVIPELNDQNWHGIFVALIAAFLVFILLFVETEITDLITVILQLPWMCCAAVQSLAHCSSLTVMKKKAPGAKCEVERVYEQRVTTIGVSILMGFFAFAGRYLRLPLASLFGVFLYLGVMNLSGVQLMHRVILFFVPVKYYPQRPYTETVKTWKMHFYTWLQIACLFFVYTIKHFKRTALMFPFVLMLFIVFRHVVLPKVFEENELKALDGEEEEEDYDNDFYDHTPIPV